MSLVDYFDNLAAHLAADSTLPELTSAQILLVTGADDEDQIKAIDQFVQARVMRTKGLAVVIYEAGGTNEAVDSQDGVIHARTEWEVRLFIHPQKWGKRYDTTKRKAREILEDLLLSLNGAAVQPIKRGCHDYTMVDAWLPVPDPEFWAWNIEGHRMISLTT